MTGIFPICEAKVTIKDGTETSEIISCSDCQNKLEVTDIKGKIVSLKEAPKVEEDWGE